MRNLCLLPSVLTSLTVLTSLPLLSGQPALANKSATNSVSLIASTANYNPAETTVAILPVINITKSKHPDKDAEMQAQQAKEGDHILAEMFEKHDFKLSTPSQITAAMSTTHFDSANQATWTPDNLAAIGDAVQANIVVLMVITDTHQGFRHGLLIMGGQREGEAKTKLWLVDVRTHSAVIDGIAAAGKSQASALMGWATSGMGEGSSAYVLKAVADAANKSLTDFLKPYPNTGKMVSLPATPPVMRPVPPAASVPTPVIKAVTPAVSAVSWQSLITFANGAQTVGNLLNFDGEIYTVSTPKGMRQFKKAAIVSIRALPPVAPTITEK